MVEKFKEAFNKFILNKYPQTVINYRNVNDYINPKCEIIQLGYRCRNVEIFAFALLLRTDIWINNSEMGHKWMIFSGRNASTMDAVQTPVNTTGSINLNHNSVHYEPIIRVEKAKVI